MGRVLQPKRDKYYNTQKKIYAAKKAIAKQPDAPKVLQNFNLNSNFTLPPRQNSSKLLLQQQPSVPLSSTPDQAEEALNPFQINNQFENNSKTTSEDLAQNEAGEAPLQLTLANPILATDNHPNNHNLHLNNNSHHQNNMKKCAALWHNALSIQREAENKAFLAAGILTALLPVVARDAEAHPDQYFNKETGKGALSEYFMSAGQKYMDAANMCIFMSSEFHDKGV